MTDSYSKKLWPAVKYRMMLVALRAAEALRMRSPRASLSHVPTEEGMVVVDWGSGPGVVTIPLAKRVGGEGKVFALDTQPLALKAVSRKAAKEGLSNIETVLIRAHPVPIPDSTVDLVVLLDTFYAVSDRSALLADIARVLKPDGELFMDPGHMDLEIASRIVENSGLFVRVELWDRDALFQREDAE